MNVMMNDVLFMFLEQHRRIFIGVHLLGMALGLGGATISDILFLRFLKDFKILQHEKDVLHLMSKIIWMAVCLLLLSGIALYLPAATRLNDSSKFQMKMIVVMVLIINGAFLSQLISPKLMRLFSGKRVQGLSPYLKNIRLLAFSLGGISIVSWYMAFVLGLMQPISLSFGTLLLVYVLLMSTVVIVGYGIGRTLLRKQK